MAAPDINTMVDQWWILHTIVLSSRILDPLNRWRLSVSLRTQVDHNIRGYMDNELMFALMLQGIKEMDPDFEGLLQFTSPLWAEGTVYVPYHVKQRSGT
eukprot:m51a1_g14009 hypothetical protein (99) ;mRNA; r:1080330-1081927